MSTNTFDLPWGSSGVSIRWAARVPAQVGKRVEGFRDDVVVWCPVNGNDRVVNVHQHVLTKKLQAVGGSNSGAAVMTVGCSKQPPNLHPSTTSCGRCKRVILYMTGHVGLNHRCKDSRKFHLNLSLAAKALTKLSSVTTCQPQWLNEALTSQSDVVRRDVVNDCRENNQTSKYC